MLPNEGFELKGGVALATTDARKLERVPLTRRQPTPLVRLEFREVLAAYESALCKGTPKGPVETSLQRLTRSSVNVRTLITGGTNLLQLQ